MTSPDNSSSSDPVAGGPRYADRSFRSVPGLLSGVLLLAVLLWLAGDAVVRGEGRTPWLALAALLLTAPLVIAFTLRPVVRAGAERLLVRNPFRTVTLPWAAVDGVRAGYSTEVLAGGSKYQMWAIPVSLRQRNRANRRRAKAAADHPFDNVRQGTVAGGTRRGHGPGAGAQPDKAWSDAAVDELRDTAERYRADRAMGSSDGEAAAATVSVRWAFEVIAPALAGGVVLLVLSLTG